jgi:hypothetical protein
MGCFSYMCSECEHPICSDSFSGEHAILMLVKDGTVIEWMQGEYDSYGRVFKMDPRPYKQKEFGLRDVTTSYEWTVMDWGDIVDLHFHGNSESGIAAYHSGCFNGDMENVDVSDDDPEQGWEDYRFPTEGTHGHGTTIKVQPKWQKAGTV